MQHYSLTLSGLFWQELLDVNTTNFTQNRTDIHNALRSDLAARFFTSASFVAISNFTATNDTLILDFTVSPSFDGTAVREELFLASARLSAQSEIDTSWLSETKRIYFEQSGAPSTDELTVLSSTAGRGETQPPSFFTSLCGSDGRSCGGWVIGAATTVLVASILILWAWRKHLAVLDAAVRQKILPARDVKPIDDDDEDVLRVKEEEDEDEAMRAPV